SSDESDSDQDSDSVDDCQQPCKYYNRGGCKNGRNCPYPHVCKYYVSGSCKYGSSCKRSHSSGGRASSGGSNPKLTNGKLYQWQLNDGRGWRDVKNDHVIEAQYSLPHTKSIKIYNTAYGALSIDFSRMRVYGKNLKVRRLDDGNTIWLWYCTLHRKWMKYGDKGNSGPVKSVDIETSFQRNPASSHSFSIGAETYEIRFPGDVHSHKHLSAHLVPAMAGLTLSHTPKWEFEGNSGSWHEFKPRPECSVTSDDIERKYQQNTSDSMAFTVNGQSYKLDFKAMIQINLTTMSSRKIRRV
uniref:Si:ch211-244b2.4 n=1 Tax=Nothobranchius furzeri TaxID=105023 RepID=A0A8C6KS64_NOTFU